MNQALICCGAAIAGYLIGNVQFAVIFSHMLHHDDVRHHGSGNAGSTNMLRVYGVRAGVMTFIGDFIKGAAAVLIGRALGGQDAAYCAALGVVTGHCWPVFFRFKGGKGVASSLGAAFLLNPIWGLIATVLGGTVAVVTRTISLASIIGYTVYLIIALIFGNTMWEKIATMILFAIVVYRHRENIIRLIQGNESTVQIRTDKEEQ